MIDYSCQVYHFALPEYLSDDLEHLQRRALRIVTEWPLGYTRLKNDEENCVRSSLMTLYLI